METGSITNKQTASGVALLTALLVVAAASVVAVAMITRQHIDLRKGENLARAEQAWQYVHGIDYWAMGRLREDLGENTTDSQADQWGIPLEPTIVLGGTISAEIEDSQGRFNLNNLIQEGKVSAVELNRFRRLLQQLEIQPDLANAVMDWIDPDGDPRYPGGAEDEVYLGMTPAYRSANAAFARVEELKLIHGVDAEVYAALSPHVTALPESVGLNINTASGRLLMSLSSGVDEAGVESLIATRENEPFDSLEAFFTHTAWAGLDDVQLQGLDVASHYFEVHGQVNLGQVELRHATLLKREDEGGVQALQRVRKGYFQ